MAYDFYFWPTPNGYKVSIALKELDQVAYIRFASVYRDFHDAEDFEEALKQLQGS